MYAGTNDNFVYLEGLYKSKIIENSNDFDAYNHLASLLSRLGRYGECDLVWRKCIEKCEHKHLSQLYRALFLITHRYFDEGFYRRDTLVPFERRTKYLPPNSLTRWSGQSLADKSIVIWTEFGLGDEIMFARFCSVFKAKLNAKRVGIICQQPLYDLFRFHLIGVDQVILDANSSAVSNFDYWIFPHSIPLYYSLEEQGIPSSVMPYVRLKNNKSKTSPPVKKDIKIGLAWKGDPSHENDAYRSISKLSLLKELFLLPNIHWVSLQKGECESQWSDIELHATSTLTLLGNQFISMLDTAQAIDYLDLVISVDTSVAHLAGAMNKLVYLMRPVYSDWRWQEGRQDSPWYPSMTIFTQAKEKCWEDVVQKIILKINELRQL